ncbi:MAG TPA: hypothetical protein VJ063_11395, partial [Verrucomicrobiae bacterium]|nr:hypothetical protein [Verrucomicrobiae bacterium]
MRSLAIILGLVAAMAWNGKAANAQPLQLILLEARMVTPTEIDNWKKDRYSGIAVILDEEIDYQALGQRVAKAGMDLYGWIEVGRNPKMATAHPRWMASLGSHEDWLKR